MTVREFPTDLVQAGEAWHKARATERAAAARVYDLIRREHEAGWSEVSLAEYAGIDRMTVRRALGKS